jgi:hypothetical protein
VCTDTIAKFRMAGPIISNQRWSTGFTVFSDPSATQANYVSFLASLAPLVATFWNTTNGPKSLSLASTGIDTIAVYHYPANSAVATISATQAITPVVGVGTGAGSASNALVLSLRTGLAGRAGRGRMYLPVTATSAINSLNQISSTMTQACADALEDLSDQLLIMTLGGVPPIMGVANPKKATPFKGATMIVCDTKVDTQRRRKDKIVPVATSIAVI